MFHPIARAQKHVQIAHINGPSMECVRFQIMMAQSVVKLRDHRTASVKE